MIMQTKIKKIGKINGLKTIFLSYFVLSLRNQKSFITGYVSRDLKKRSPAKRTHVYHRRECITEKVEA